LPDLQDSYRVRRNRSADKKVADDGERLRQFLSGNAENAATAAVAGGQGAQGGQGGLGVQVMRAFRNDRSVRIGNWCRHCRRSRCWNQQRCQCRRIAAIISLAKQSGADAMADTGASPVSLARMREQMPEAFHQGVAPQTLEVLSQVFDEVFRNDEIPVAVKQLISLLQIPVLKAAMLDQQFFFNNEHPARRLIDALSRFSPGVDESKAGQDCCCKACKSMWSVSPANLIRKSRCSMKRCVIWKPKWLLRKKRLNKLCRHRSQCAAQRKIRQATVTANHEVELRVGGEIVAFVETFLENRWVSADAGVQRAG
jgi:hypothetical protein